MLQKGDQVRATDVTAIGDLAGEALAAGGGLIREMHHGIASRPFAALGAAAAPARVIHDGVSHTVYAGVRTALRAAAKAGAAAVAAGRPEDGVPALAERTGGSIALGALNGLYGDHLTTKASPLALEMTIRRDGEDVTPAAWSIAQAFGDATSRIAVFVHGLCETDEAWHTLPLRGREPGRRSYGERLQDELSFTPVEVRYNTGLRISRNGRALAELLDRLVTAWPVAVAEIVLVGHSMGGLVARSACHYGEVDGRRWTNEVRHVFCLGTPHLGADLEKGVHVLGHALGRLPETRAIAKLLTSRSVGIKDLRYGACIDEDWVDCDPDEFLRDRCNEVPFLPDANYYFIGATLGRGPLGQLLGDLLVRSPSASGRGNGRGRRIPFEVDNGHEIEGINHFDLLNHPAVYEQLRAWITRTVPRRRGLALPAGT